MYNNLHLTEKLKNLPQPAYRFLPEQSEYKSEEVLLSHGKEHWIYLRHPLHQVF